MDDERLVMESWAFSPTNYGVIGSSNLSEINPYIDMENTCRFFSNHWACFARIKITNNTYNPYYYCVMAVGGFSDIFNEIRIKLTNIQLDLISENVFNLLSSKAPPKKPSGYGWGCSLTMLLTKDFNFKEDDKYISVGTYDFPVFRVSYNDKFTPKAISHLNYYIGVTFRNSNLGEMEYNTMERLGSSVEERVQNLLEKFNTSKHKFEQLLSLSTGHSGHGTSRQKITESDWLLIDNYEIVNEFAKNNYPSQDGFFTRLWRINQEMQKPKVTEISPEVPKRPRAVRRVVA